MKKYILFVFISLLVLSCKTSMVNSSLPIQAVSLSQKSEFTENELKTWHHKDILEDTIPGISLDKAYRELIKDKKGKEIIVAVIDTKLDIFHEDIKEQLWVNKNEIPDNGIDDDKNGYIDDTHGWNFLGNSKGEDVIYSNFESIRIIRKYEAIFKGKSKSEIDDDSLNKYNSYWSAKEGLEMELKEGVENQSIWTNFYNAIPKSRVALKEFFPKEDYTISQLEDLSKIHKNDTILSPLIYYMHYYLTYNYTDKKMLDRKKSADIKVETSLSLNYNERDLIGDDPDDLNNTDYGNNLVYNDSVPFQHAIRVAGAIAANRENNIGAKGVYDKAKIMSLCVAPSGGDEHDKDITLAIRYAVNNGAKIINMSFGKPFSLCKEWVDDAIRYANSKDVLIVCSAGNDGREVTYEKNHYPNDQAERLLEISNNLMKVGASYYTLDKNLKSSSSNYSKEHVDVFAPGRKIYSPMHGNKYEARSGTSYSAPIVSGVAALIRSYYPKLTASQVKEIIMESGVSYDIDVEIKNEDGTKKLVPFSELSKSGKIVNAYNALLMADQVSKKKKK